MIVTCLKKRLAAVQLGMCVLAAMSAGAQVDVLTQHNDNTRTGVNLRETVLTPENVNKARFGMLFKRVVDDQLYSQPLIVTGVEVGGGTHDIVYVTTVNNSVYAFDANDAAAAAPIWHVKFGLPANMHSTNFGVASCAPSVRRTEPRNGERALALLLPAESLIWMNSSPIGLKHSNHNWQVPGWRSRASVLKLAALRRSQCGRRRR